LLYDLDFIWRDSKYKMKFYKESSGDYLVIFENVHHMDDFEGRAAAIGNEKSSCCTTMISRKYLEKECKSVKKKDVPKEWLYQLIGE